MTVAQGIIMAQQKSAKNLKNLKYLCLFLNYVMTRIQGVKLLSP